MARLNRFPVRSLESSLRLLSGVLIGGALIVAWLSADRTLGAQSLGHAAARMLPALICFALGGVLWSAPVVLRGHALCVRQHRPLSVFWRVTAVGLAAQGFGALVVALGLGLGVCFVATLLLDPEALLEVTLFLLLSLAYLGMGIAAWLRGRAILAAAPQTARGAKRDAVAWLRRRAKHH